MNIVIPKANTGEAAYIKECLNHFRVAMPEATAEQRRSLATKTLFRMRLWRIIYEFRIKNYSIPDVLDAEYVDD